MQSEKVNAADASGVILSTNNGVAESVGVTGSYRVSCLDAAGNVKWEDDFSNLVTTVGKNDLLDKYLAGSGYTAAWYLGLVDGASTPTYAAGDTSASHAGWTESVVYSNSTRPAVSWNSASAGSKASTATSFSINGSGTIAGAFLISVSTKSGTTGILYSVGNFTGGSRIVASGDTLNVTYTASV